MRNICRWGAAVLLLAGCSDPPLFVGIFLTPGIGVSTTFTTIGALRGTTVQIPPNISRVQGFSGPVDLALGTLPAGITGTLTPTTVPADVTTASLSITVSASAPLGSALVIVRGKGGSVADAELDITVNANP